jgi:hypothetical protein
LGGRKVWRARVRVDWSGRKGWRKESEGIVGEKRDMQSDTSSRSKNDKRRKLQLMIHLVQLSSI